MVLLEHPDKDVRKGVMESLRAVVPKKEKEIWREIFGKLLKDEERELYDLAWGDLLANCLRNVEYIGSLVHDQEHEWRRLEAINALVALGPLGAAASPSVVKLLKDKACPEKLKRPAVLALASMMNGDPAAMGLLRDISKDPKQVDGDLAKQGFMANTLPGSVWRVHDGGKGYRFEFRGNGRYKVRNLATNSVGYGNYRFKKCILLAGRLRGTLAIENDFNVMKGHRGVYDTDPDNDGPVYEGTWQFYREKR
jgi:hypothetical protein